MKPKIHTDKALRDIADFVRYIQDDEALWYKVNWVTVDTSHNICRRKGRIGHIKRQAIRHRLWRMAKRRHSELRKFRIPFEIRGDSPCKIKWHYKLKPRKTGWKPTRYYHKNIPALITAIITGIFLIFVPIMDRKTIFENIYPHFIYFNLESLDSVSILISVVLGLIIFGLFLLNGLGVRPNRYSKYAGYLSILYFCIVLLENILFIENTNPLSILNFTPISYWIASFGVSITGIVYLIFFEAIHWNKENRWKVSTFTLVCLSSLFLLGAIMPIIVSSTGSLMTEHLTELSYSPNSKHQDSRYTADQNGQQAFAIYSEDAEVPITEILNRHNYYRNTVNGKNIPNLKWSSTLAASAQSYADHLGDNNLFEHSGGLYGENLAAGQPSWTSAIDAWGSEKSHFVYAPFGNDASDTTYWGDVGHYTQIIWKTTTECGCGSAPHSTYRTVYVCQYSPAGNIVGYYPY